MHLASLHSAHHLPSLKRVESAGNIAEESDEEIQIVRGRNIIGSGRDFVENEEDSDKDSSDNNNKFAKIGVSNPNQ